MCTYYLTRANGQYTVTSIVSSDYKLLHHIKFFIADVESFYEKRLLLLKYQI